MLQPPAISLDSIRLRRDEILRVVTQNNGRKVRVFGSVARDEATVDSDLDLLVDFAPGSSLLDLINIASELSDLLGFKVDVVSRGALKPRETRILEEAKSL